MSAYKRILLKLSGEALAGNNHHGIDPQTLINFAQEIISVTKQNVQLGIVLGGGNFFRGIQGEKIGINRVKGDYMGMLATVMNALALESQLNFMGQKAITLTSTFMEPFAQRYSQSRAIQALENGYVTIFAGGTGNPFFTTDSAAALRALEINADILLKGTNVDGVYDKDPKLYPDAKKFDKLSFQTAIEKQLHVMDITAFAMCAENNLPIIVFNIHEKGNLLKIINGEKIGTLVC